MARYLERLEDGLYAPLRGPGSARKRLGAFLRHVTDLQCGADPSCLMTKAAIDKVVFGRG